MKKTNLIPLILLILVSTPSLSWALEFHVSTIEELYQAINQANSDVDEDVIILAPGEYQLQGSSGDDDNLSGDLDIKTNLILQGAGTRDTIIRGSPVGDRVIHVPNTAADVNLTLMDLTIRDGNLFENSNGGGVFFAVDGDLEILRCSIVENRIQQGAGTGGGLRFGGQYLLVEDSIIANNKSQGVGGGIDSDSHTALIRNSTISGNLAEGGIGGALLTGLGDHVISDSTITQNESLASDGDFTGGIRGDNLILKNSIIAGNVSSSTPENIVDCDEAVTSQDYNVFGIGCPGLVPGPNDQIGTVNDPLDPLLGELQNNGGPTDTHALLESSPAIDKGDPNCAGTDQRGVARPQGNACDIGAYEANCGDAIAQGAEECDDGNTDPDDDCDNTCKLTSTGGGIDNGSNGGCALIDKSSYNAIGMLGAALGMMLMGLIRWRKQQ